MFEHDNVEIVRVYFDCYAQRDRATLEKLLVKSLVFKSSYAVYTDRDEMLDEIWPHVITNRSRVENLKCFQCDDQVIARYDLINNGVTRICELFEFETNRIKSIEVFVGASTQS